MNNDKSNQGTHKNRVLKQSNGSHRINQSMMVDSFKPLRTSEVVFVLQKEYQRWAEDLTKYEIRAIRKYTKNSFEIDSNKFYMRLNAMLRGD